MRKPSSLPGLIFFVILAIGLTVAYLTFAFPDYRESASIAVGSAVVAFIVSYAIKIANQWERVVVLRLGRFHMLGPLLHHPDPRHGRLSDRHPCHHQHVQGGKDDDARHRALLPGHCRSVPWSRDQRRARGRRSIFRTRTAILLN